MKQATRLALVTSGPTRHSIFASFPELAAHLGPIRATSSRTASRSAKVLGGGWSARGWPEVLATDVIAIQAPGPKLLTEMLALGKGALQGRVVLACDAQAEMRSLAQLEALGVIVVHLWTLNPREPLVALSGDTFGVTRTRRLLARAGIRCLTIRDGAGPRLLAGVAQLEEEIAAALRRAGEAFMYAGLKGPEARTLGVGAALRALRR